MLQIYHEIGLSQEVHCQTNHQYHETNKKLISSFDQLPDKLEINSNAEANIKVAKRN